jgi:hypothetical protein
VSDNFEPSVPEGFEDIEAAADAAIDDGDLPAWDTPGTPVDPSYGDPNPLGADVESVGAEVSDLGQVHVKARNLMVIVTLPQYLKDGAHPEKGEDRSLQLQMLDHDVREAMVLAARRLNDNALKYSVTGWDWDLEDIEYDIPAPRTVMASLRLTRE